MDHPARFPSCLAVSRAAASIRPSAPLRLPYRRENHCADKPVGGMIGSQDPASAHTPTAAFPLPQLGGSQERVVDLERPHQPVAAKRRREAARYGPTARHADSSTVGDIGTRNRDVDRPGKIENRPTRATGPSLAAPRGLSNA